MKPLTRSLLSTLLAFSASAFMLRAQEPAGGDPFVKGSSAASSAAKARKPESPDCFFVMDVYSLERSDAAALLGSEHGSAARYRRVVDLMKAGKAKLEILTGLATKSGQRALSESVDELRFPFAFSETNNPESGPRPIEWSLHKVGDTVEIEAVVGPDGQSCDLNLAPSHARLAGFRDLAPIAGDSAVTQPQFETQGITLSIQATDGEPFFLGTFSPPTPLGLANGGAASPVWLAFVHLDVLKRSPDAGKTAANPQPTGKPLDWSSIDLEYTCYSLDAALAREILTSPGAPNASWEKLQALLEKKEARLEDIELLKARSGQRVATHASQEIRSATVSAGDHARGSVQNSPRQQNEAPKKEDGKSAAAAAGSEGNHAEPGSRMTPGPVMSFESRSVGVSIECEPYVPNDAFVEVNQALECVTYPGDLKTPGAGLRYPPQPIFQTRKIITSQGVPVGRRVLVGTLNPPASDGATDPAGAGRVYLLFLRATPNEP